MCPNLKLLIIKILSQELPASGLAGCSVGRGE